MSRQQWNQKLQNILNWLFKRLRAIKEGTPKFWRANLVLPEIVSLPLDLIREILTELQRQGRKVGRKFNQWFSTQMIRWLRRPEFRRAGFLLPTVAALLVVLSLVVGSVLFRALVRNTQVTADRQEQVIFNAATPALDRAKAKVEYLFARDPRFPAELASSARLESMLLNDGINADVWDSNTTASGVQNPYNIVDETRLDINNDNTADNAWSFKLDVNGDGDEETVAYSIILKTTDDNGTASTSDDIDRTRADNIKAAKLVIRNAPINITRPSGACENPNLDPKAGWDQITTATVRRAFQVTAVVVDDNQTYRNITTLELQQDRQADTGNKWGAWFRNDLEIFPGPTFRWNGSMHTEGNFTITNGNGFRSFLISDADSCVYSRENSELTMGTFSANTNPSQNVFEGQMIAGSVRDNNYSGTSEIDIFGQSGPSQIVDFSSSNDSVTPSGGALPADMILDPVVIYTTNGNMARGSDITNQSQRSSSWATSTLPTQGRAYNSASQPPYVDDTYRADDRYGPKPEYTSVINPFILNGVPTGRQSGDLINAGDINAGDLTSTDTDDPENGNGLDGYWERRAWAEGLRIIVGERLELGNAFGWKTTWRDLDSDSVVDFAANNSLFEISNDPLYPPRYATNNANYCQDSTGGSPSNTVNRCHEHKQFRTLRDNLAAVQSTVIYHNTRTAGGGAPSAGEYPLACLATVAHPGTRAVGETGNTTQNRSTLFQSTTFDTITVNGQVRIDTDFLTGRGTNGWEFNAPANVNSGAAFAATIANGTPLRRALDNLAHFAGDGAPENSNDFGLQSRRFGFYGAFPPLQENNASPLLPALGAKTHPYGNLSMWGNYSNLRRVLRYLDTGTSYDNLSIADKTTLHTAACTLGMIAYQIDNLQDYRYDLNQTGTQGMIALDTALAAIGGGAGVPDRNATSEDYINQVANGSTVLGRVAKLVMLKEQVQRDRRFGFMFPWKEDPQNDLTQVSGGLQVLPNNLPNGTTAAIPNPNPVAVRTNPFPPTANPNPALLNSPNTVYLLNRQPKVLPDPETITSGGITYRLYYTSAGVNGYNSPATNSATSDPTVALVPAMVDDVPVAGTPPRVGFLALNFNPSLFYDTNLGMFAQTLVMSDKHFNATNSTVQNATPAPASNYLIFRGQDIFTRQLRFINMARTVEPHYQIRWISYANNFTYGGYRYSYDCPDAANALLPNLEYPKQPCISSKTYMNLRFNPAENNYFGFGPPTDVASERRFIRLATVFNPKNPKYPSLFYLFPRQRHDSVSLQIGVETVRIPDVEPYVNDRYIYDNSINGPVNNVYQYQVLTDTNANNIEDRNNLDNSGEDGIGAMALQPRTLGSGVLPYTTTNTGRVNLIRNNTGGAAQIGVAFLDKGVFNGREMMGLRLLDIDLDLLRRNAVGNDSWLPYSGVVYAFREDAVREDGIVRPSNTTFTSCDTAGEIAGTTNCRMNAVETNFENGGVNAFRDPPVNPLNYISPKPVDFFPDPDRRPNGFRLRNGESLRRIPDPPGEFTYKGMAFITDNLLYLVGDNQNGDSLVGFNFHMTGSTIIEEFTQLLNASWSNFYNRSTLNVNFAREQDNWRPAEILADGITIASTNFIDGSPAEGILEANVANSNNSSYRKINAPNDSVRSWVREDGSVSDDVNYTVPIKISRNGYPIYCVTNAGADSGNLAVPLTGNAVTSPVRCTSEYGRREIEYGRESGNTNVNSSNNRTFMNFSEGKPNTATPSDPVRINASIISGIVPSRPNQAYGGFHNFPRFQETWNDLILSGAFIQLSFSTQATSPFDQDSWEPGNTTQGSESINYYGAPGRRWGYDVGLQYTPAGPVAKRMVTASRTRSEFYRELPANDPYVCNLRKARIPGGASINIDTTVSDCT